MINFLDVARLHFGSSIKMPRVKFELTLSNEWLTLDEVTPDWVAPLVAKHPRRPSTADTDTHLLKKPCQPQQSGRIDKLSKTGTVWILWCLKRSAPVFSIC